MKRVQESARNRTGNVWFSYSLIRLIVSESLNRLREDMRQLQGEEEEEKEQEQQ